MTEERAAIDRQHYRRVVSHFATGVTVVSTVHDGVRYGMTVNSFTSVSLDPLLVLFCCELEAAFHEPVTAAGVWGVSILASEQVEQARWFAHRGAPGVDQFDDIAYRSGPELGVPLLDGAVATLEVRTRAEYDGGDHCIVLGDVLSVWSASEPGGVAMPAAAVDGDSVDGAAARGAVGVGAEPDPLLYVRSRWAVSQPLGTTPSGPGRGSPQG